MHNSNQWNQDTHMKMLHKTVIYFMLLIIQAELIELKWRMKGYTDISVLYNFDEHGIILSPQM